MSDIRRLFLRLLSLFRHGSEEADLEREIDAHLRLLQDDFVARGMSADEARYAARRAFGGVVQVKERHRDARSWRWLAGWSVDLKLGARMLVKYPGLTIVGGLAMAFAIAVGAAGFEALTQLLAPTIPFDDGTRIVGIRNWDVSANREEPHAAHHFVAWREQLRGVQDLGAFRTVERNLVAAADDAGEPVQVAEISASAFRVTRVAPFLGRSLEDGDERTGAPPVAVIGYDLWQKRFHTDPRVAGRTIRLGRDEFTVVGVMPLGFAFPISHEIWVPLRLDVSVHPRRAGPELHIFGRLMDGVSIEQAQAAASAAAARDAATFPADAHLQPQVIPYARSVIDVTEVAFGGTALNVFLVMFLALVCANVAALIFARAVTREHEIVVRNALGASRGRIVMQLFAEALVLGVVAAAVGLATAGFALRWWMSVSAAEAGGRLPFWLNGSVSPRTVFYTAGLAVFGAAIAGIAPALKVTGRRLEGRLREAASGGSDARFGGLWTVVIVTQVAVTVAFPASAFFARQYVTGIQSLDPGVDAHRYLAVRIEADPEAGGSTRSTLEELERRLETDPAIAGVTFATRLPRTVHPQRRIEVDGDPGAGDQSVTTASVALDYFDVLEAAPLAGRTFTSGDPAADAGSVVVNQSFVRRVLGSHNAIGRRVRYAASAHGAASRWFEIVGVVKDLGMIHDDASNGAGVYHPLVRGGSLPIQMAVQSRGAAAQLAPRVRAIALAVDPSLRLHDVLPLDRIGSTMWRETDFLFRLLVLVSAVALLLSLAGIYSIMSLTVSRRTREIGIRVAIGADPRRIVSTISARALRQVGIGILAGGGLVFALMHAIHGLTTVAAAVICAYMALMLGICMLATVVPTRRALRVAPTEALRAQ